MSHQEIQDMYFARYQKMVITNPVKMFEDMLRWESISLEQFAKMSFDDQTKYADYVTVSSCEHGIDTIVAIAQDMLNNFDIGSFNKNICSLSNMCYIAKKLKDGDKMDEYNRLIELIQVILSQAD